MRSMMQKRKRTVPTIAIIAIVLLLISPVHCNDDATTEKIKNDPPQCERLPTSLTYKQDAAPADVSAILRVVVEKINRDVTGVVDVEVCFYDVLYLIVHIIFS